jgi:hypothetical protein
VRVLFQVYLLEKGIDFASDGAANKQWWGKQRGARWKTNVGVASAHAVKKTYHSGEATDYSDAETTW